jgi:DNA repair protein RecN (Recombination protein N)
VLSELRVRDLGVIEDVSLTLRPGMTALTGETGAGKTLLVEALQLVLGGRPSASLVRAGADEAMVEARFLEGEHEVILARSVPADGRSRAWIDGRMAPVTALAERGAPLVDIHGQHDHQSLLTPAAQTRALDAYAGTDLAPLGETRRRRRDLQERLAALGGDERERAREADVLRHQVAEIEAAGITDTAEEEVLAEEEDRLADMGAHREAVGAGLDALRGAVGHDDPVGAVGALDLVGAAVAALGGRPGFTTWVERLRAAQADLDDVAAELRDALETWEDDPDRLAVVQARRRLLSDVRRKYGGTLAEVRAFGESAAKRLEDLLAAEETAERLAVELAAAESEVRRAESRVRAVRAGAAPALAHAVAVRLARLAMPGARLEVSVGGDGAGDPARFLLGANPGEPVQPLARVASGGELARAMLALRLVTSGGPSTMVFDEVDAGVGGEAALALAGALHEVSDGHQVLVVTHLPQVAAFADHQVAVRKTSRRGRTATEVAMLGGPERVVEISRMLSGHPDSATARAHARELLAQGRSANPGAPGD